jgi:periplasmic divalent cation tolerance protein
MRSEETPMTAVRIVFCTIDSAEAARILARKLVQERLAACVNIIDNVTSVYRWEDRIEEDGELLMVIKTRESRLQELMDRLAELHSYDVPEILSWPVQKGSKAYLEWVLSETG